MPPKKTNKFPPKKTDKSYIVKANPKHNWSDYQKDLFRDIAKGEGHTVVEAFAGAAKCLGKGTQVLLFDGSCKCVEDIVPGDILMGPDSAPRNVISTNAGYGDLVKIVPTKGDPWVCNIDHILTLKGTNNEKNKIIDISVADFCSRYGHYKELSKQWKLFKTKIEFPTSAVEYDPYLIGLWIGDGTKAEASISNIEPEIIEYCKCFAFQNNLLLRLRFDTRHNYYNIRFAMGKKGEGHRGTPHLLKRFLTNKCVVNGAKVIPQNYLINSEENRLQLLAGLIDTDGTFSKGYFSISSSDEKLAEQYLFLARSLGFASYIKSGISQIRSKNFIGKYWRVSIIGDVNRIPTKVARKQAGQRKQIKNPLVNGFNILEIGSGDFYGFVLDGDGRFLLSDFTITHNTSSIIESFKYIPKGKKTLALAFNKIIQEELRARSPSYIDTLTFHSVGFRAIKQRFGNVELDDNKVFNIVANMLDKYTDHDLIVNVCDTVAFCKYGLIDIPSQIDDIIDRFGIDVCGFDRKAFINLVIKALSADKLETSKIDFNDMCWFPFVYNLSLGQYDYIFVDEVQDLNKAQLIMAKKACKPGGRIIAVGDSFQALYSWRMADTAIIEDIKNQNKSKILPLPISYRCPRSVIDLAKNWVPTITCPETAIDGEIKDISLNQLYSLAKPGCFVLSRTNAPLIKICMNFIRNGVRANIRGRDVGKQLAYLIKRSKRKQIPAFLKWLEEWKDGEVKKLQDKNINTDNVLDRFECLVNLCDECKTLDEVNKRIDELFNDTDEEKIVILSTVHRAKGLERDNVFVLRWTFRIWLDDCSLIEPPNEEANIAYVAATRSKNNLFIVRKWNEPS